MSPFYRYTVGTLRNHYILCLFFFGFGFPSLYGQSSSGIVNSWVSMGPGMFLPLDKNSSGGFTFYISDNWSLEKVSEINTGLRRVSKIELRGMLDFEVGWDENHPGLWRQDVALLYGQTFGKVFQAGLAGGLGLFRSTENVKITPTQQNPHPGYEFRKYLSPNITFELNLGFIPVKFFGIGITGFTNINSRKPMYGFLFVIKMGEMR